MRTSPEHRNHSQSGDCAVNVLCITLCTYADGLVTHCLGLQEPGLPTKVTVLVAIVQNFACCPKW